MHSWSTSYSATHTQTRMQTHIYLDRWIDRYKPEVLLNSSIFISFLYKDGCLFPFLDSLHFLCFTFYAFSNCLTSFFYLYVYTAWKRLHLLGVQELQGWQENVNLLVIYNGKGRKTRGFFPEVECFWKVFHQTLSTTTPLIIVKIQK